MDVFAKTVIIDSRSTKLHVYWIHDLHKGAPNFDEARLKRVINLIKKDKEAKIVLLGGDLCDLVVLRDMKRFSPDNLDDDTLSGPPAQIRKNLSNLAYVQAEKIVALLDPIKEFIIGSVYGNHERSVLKSSGIDVHSIVCNKLGIRNCGGVGMVAITMKRSGKGRIFKIAFMHTASGGRTAGASNNSLARAMNIFDSDIILQGHNHSPAFQRITSLDMTTPAGHIEPKVSKRDRVGINNGAFVMSYMKDTNSYDQDNLYNPKSEVFHRASVMVIREKDASSKSESEPSRLSIVVEELHI